MSIPIPELPEDNTTICLVIPDSQSWRQIYMGALLILQQWWYYDTNDSAEVEDVVQRVMECHYLTTSDYEGCMELDCNDVLDCINESEGIQQAIGKFSLTSSITSTSGENQENLDTDLFGGQSPCSNDELYGMCVQLTSLLNTVSENLLDIFVNGLNNAGNLGYLIEAIPVVGELPFDDILEFLQKVAVEINTAYQAAYDTQLAEDISCLFFCEALDDCELTFEDARDVIGSQLASPVSVDDFVSVVNDMIANNWFGDQSVWVFHYFILETIIMGGEILGLDVNRFATTVATYFNDPNSDWDGLCTDCAYDWSHSWLSESPNPLGENWVLDLGEYDSGDNQIDWEFNGSSSNSILLRYVFGEESTITRVVYSGDVRGEGGRLQRIWIYDDNDVQQYYSAVQAGTNSEVPITHNTGLISVTVQADWYIVIGMASKASATPSGTCELKNLRIEGEGDDPFD